MFFDSEPFRALVRANKKFTYPNRGGWNLISGSTMEANNKTKETQWLQK
jgi:hypothetical protein